MTLMSCKRLSALILFVSALFAFTPITFAQNITGEIDGIVADPSGAVIPGATVVITNLATKQVARTVTSNSKGEYTAALLAVGDYAISVTADGFETTNIASTTVNVGENKTSNITLRAGGANESVTVDASTVSPNTETAENSAVINENQMKELALNTRNFEQILTIQPGVSYTGPDQLSSGLLNAQGATNPASLSVNGLQPTQLSFNFDGADTLNRITIAQTVIFPGIDTINQVKVLRDSYGAQYGGGGSAQVLIVSKAGGDAFHGDAFFFFRNQYLNANNFFNLISTPAQPRPPIRYNDFGYTLGGPLYIPHLLSREASKTYFFVGEELRRLQSNPTVQVGNYPYLAQANGYFADPVCVQSGGVSKDPAGRAYQCATNQASPFVANSPFPGFNYQVPTITATSQQYLKDIILPALAIEQPNSPNKPQALVLSQKSTTNGNQILARVDHQFSSRLSAFFRYVYDPYNMQVPDGYNQATGFPNVNTSNAQTYGEDFLAHGTSTLTPDTVLDFGYSYLPYQIKTQVIGFSSAAVSPDIQVQTPFPNTTGRVPTLSIGGGNWGPNGPVTTLNHTQQVFLNATKQLGQHTLQFGINYEHYYATTNQGTLNSGQFVFIAGTLPLTKAQITAGGATTTAYEQSFANFLTGTISSFSQESIDPISGIASNLTEGYVQDNWRAKPHLTLQGGVRYSVFGQPYDRFGHLGVFEPNAYSKSAAPNLGSSGFECLPGTTEISCKGIAANPNYNALNGIVQGGINSPYGLAVSRRSFLNIAPRVGFAYDVFGDGKTSFRGGYGIFFNQIANTISEQQVQGNPAYVQTATYDAASFATPGAGTNANAIPLTVSGSTPNWKSPYTQAYSLDLQQQLDPSTVVTIAYVGNKTFHLQGVEDVNQPQPGEFAHLQAAAGSTALVPTNNAAGAALLNPDRPYLGYESINYFDTRYFADYNGLQVGLIRTFAKARGARLSVNYTWSKALANSSGFSNGPQNTYDLSSEYGPTPSDRRQLFNTSLAYLLPFFRKQEGVKGKLLGGYEIAAIVTAVSGISQTATFTQTDPGGQGWQFNVSDSVTRPDQVADANQGATHSISQYFNKNAFIQVPVSPLDLSTYRPGNARVGTIDGPGY